MSRENAEIVRSIYVAFAHGDSEMPFRLYAPDIEWDARRYSPLGPSALYRGHDGVREMFRDLLTEFDNVEYWVINASPAVEHVLVTAGERGVGRRSGASVDGRHYALWTLSDGMVTRVCTFLDHGEALRAAGLTE